jgi:uncharacterized membrane protein YdbT with pleckstrin-like domain
MPDIFVSSPKKRIESEAKQIIKKVGEQETKNPLAAFVALPKGVKFKTQEQEEYIILLLRRHWITNIYWIAIAFLMILAPLITMEVPLLSFMPQRFQLMTVIIWYLVTLAFVFENFLSWFFNVYIITDERIIDVDFTSLTYRRISDAQIERIQDITYKTGGLLRAVFDFGDVYVQTAGKAPEIDFEAVPKPDKVVRVLNQLIIQEQQEKIEGRVR